MSCNQRQARLQSSRRTNEFAEGRQFKRDGQNQYEDYQQKIFHAQKFSRQKNFRRRDFIQQLLNQSERTQEAADRPSQNQGD